MKIIKLNLGWSRFSKTQLVKKYIWEEKETMSNAFMRLYSNIMHNICLSMAANENLFINGDFLTSYCWERFIKVTFVSN